MSEERYKLIKENVYTRCHIAYYTGIGLSFPDKEEIELIDYVEELKDQLQQKENKEKEIREYIMTELITEWDIKNNGYVSGSDLPVDAITPILKILDKGE